MIAPLNLEVPLLTPPFLQPTASYALVKTIEARLKLTESFHPLLAWRRGGIMDSAPHLNILEAMDLQDKVTGYFKKMWK